VLQPLDVSFFGLFKSYIQREVYAAARYTQVLTVFDVAHILKTTLSDALTTANIISGFTRTGTWDNERGTASVAALQHLPFFDNDEMIQNGSNSTAYPTLTSVIESPFNGNRRSLLRSATVPESGTIRISATSGAHLTSDAVLTALQERAERRAAASSGTSRELREERFETASEKRHLGELAGERTIRKQKLDRTRCTRRTFARFPATSTRFSESS